MLTNNFATEPWTAARAQTAQLGPQKTHSLKPGASETLRVVPVQKRFRLVMATKGTWSDVAGSAINLHLEGNWMPLRVEPMPLSSFRLIRINDKTGPGLVLCSHRLLFKIAGTHDCSH